jgi:hypothetical protein
LYIWGKAFYISDQFPGDLDADELWEGLWEWAYSDTNSTWSLIGRINIQLC